jgi:hypothetical protein
MVRAAPRLIGNQTGENQPRIARMTRMKNQGRTVSNRDRLLGEELATASPLIREIRVIRGQMSIIVTS